ncbi:hypothetical protein K32_18450 [Kaistia sp. 32K]|uniref:hypothetical protein n=1 Tax=Kaistia sp. 32K TaxID=2795690 RepID=UPI001915CF51|nr:hypothetical protein [Kaistia sp. 32K]BCP53228.1 hypothetical protein K32_18450 [Kaistia sp. 32K]
MKKLSLIATAALMLALPAVGHAQQKPTAPPVMVSAGKCDKLVVAGKDATKQCKNEVASAPLPGGVVMFIFTQGKTLIGFTGDATKLAGDTKTGIAGVPVVEVSVRSGKEPKVLKAKSGVCKFSDPYSGKPAIVSCTADTAEGRFTGSFKSNGKAPQAR